MESDDVTRMMHAANTRAEWLRNIARLLWLSSSISGRNITASDNTAARQRAIEAFVAMRRITKERMALSADVYVTPDYALYGTVNTYRLFFKVVVADSDPIRVESVEMIDGGLLIKTEGFYITLPYIMTDAEKEDMAKFLRLTANADPLSEVVDAPRRGPRVPAQDMGRDEEALLRQEL